ncbi:MAG TPA: nucleoside monophosphate kinase [Blastocatellia bacterium]|nr:nucleoside monophosphate kinase [Blastocatellia bacterium]
MPYLLVLMGPQGAGKGTQAAKLASRLGMSTVATGDILRKVGESDTPLSRQIRETQAAGRLVSDDVMAGIIQERLAREDCKSGCILDGFPRTLPQAALLDQFAEQHGFKVSAVIIVVQRDMLEKRLTGRRTCSVCGHIYNIYFKPSKDEGVCDLDGGALLMREDDNPAAIKKRLDLFDQMTLPLLDYYRKTGRLGEVDGEGDICAISDRISSAVAALTAGASGV